LQRRAPLARPRPPARPPCACFCTMRAAGRLFRNSAILRGAENACAEHLSPGRASAYGLPQSSAAPRNKGPARAPWAWAKAPKPFRDKDLSRAELFRTNLEEPGPLRNSAGSNRGELTPRAGGPCIARAAVSPWPWPCLCAQEQTAERLGLRYTLRARGRPPIYKRRRFVKHGWYAAGCFTRIASVINHWLVNLYPCRRRHKQNFTCGRGVLLLRWARFSGPSGLRHKAPKRRLPPQAAAKG
jgi:hypothetical protein